MALAFELAKFAAAVLILWAMLFIMIFVFVFPIAPDGWAYVTTFGLSGFVTGNFANVMWNNL